MVRCLYNSDFATFLDTDSASIYRILDDNYHGEALTTTRDAWKTEIDIMKNVVSSLDKDGQIIFEYDIPRLGKRIDVVLLYRGSGKEVDPINIQLMVNILKRDFAENQIIIASIFEYDFDEVELIEIKNRLIFHPCVKERT